MGGKEAVVALWSARAGQVGSTAWSACFADVERDNGRLVWGNWCMQAAYCVVVATAAVSFRLFFFAFMFACDWQLISRGFGAKLEALGVGASSPSHGCALPGQRVAHVLLFTWVAIRVYSL